MLRNNFVPTGIPVVRIHLKKEVIVMKYSRDFAIEIALLFLLLTMLHLGVLVVCFLVFSTSSKSADLP